MQTSNLRDRLLSACYAGWLASVAFQLKICFPFSVFRFPFTLFQFFSMLILPNFPAKKILGNSGEKEAILVSEDRRSNV